jgi:hypothetical protein
MFRLHKKIKDEPVVPDKLKEKIDYRIFGIIAAIVIGYQFYLYTFKNPNDPTINFLATFVYCLTAFIAAIAAFLVSRQYWESEVFGKSYLALAIGMMMNVIGDGIYYILELQGQVPSPSISDWASLSFYPLIFYHIAKNVSFFKPTVKKTTKLLVVVMPIVIAGVYAFLEYGQEQAADTTFFLGLAYIVGSTVILSAGLLGALVFRQGVLGVPWLVLALGIVLSTVGDVWYSYLDIYNQYTTQHPVNLLWSAGFLVIAYSLYKHKKVI